MKKYNFTIYLHIINLWKNNSKMLLKLNFVNFLGFHTNLGGLGLKSQWWNSNLMKFSTYKKYIIYNKKQ